MLELIYPSVCGICGKLNKKSLCKKCEIKIKEYEINKIIDIQQNENYFFDFQVKTYMYKDIIRNKMLDYKFNEKSYLAETFEKMITKNEKICSFLKKYDIILYVPMFKKHKLQRGYNQSELIAKKIAKTLGIDFEKNNLIKIVDTRKQSTLTKIERKTNIENAFEVAKPERINNKKVILFDDIYTTGSTANECSKVLKQAGANEIAILTIAVD